MKSIISIAIVFLLFTFQANAQKEVPNISVKALDGSSINMDEITKEKGVKIISFWATWCKPCLDNFEKYFLIKSNSCI